MYGTTSTPGTPPHPVYLSWLDATGQDRPTAGESSTMTLPIVRTAPRHVRPRTLTARLRAALTR